MYNCPTTNLSPSLAANYFKKRERERERERERLDRDRETDADQQIHNTQASPRPTKNKTSPFNHHIKTKQKIHFKNLITR